MRMAAARYSSIVFFIDYVLVIIIVALFEIKYPINTEAKSDAE